MDSKRTTFLVNGVQVACGELTSLPGCSQAVVFHGAFVLPQHRNAGVGKAAHQARLQEARELLYDAGICTVVESNEYQSRILQATGWTQVLRFYSRRSKQYIQIWVCQL